MLRRASLGRQSLVAIAQKPRAASTHFGLALLLAAGVLTTLPAVASSDSKGDWNDDGIEWIAFQQGIDRVEKTGKPGLLVFFTTWCPHCHNYSRVFHDPEVIALAKRFVMIRVDRDRHPEINEQYGQHGSYVPRTLFLGAGAKVDWTQTGSNPDYPYFLDEHTPKDLLRLMRAFAGAEKTGD